MDTSTIVILDFGSQYTQLIARRIREFNVFSVVLPCTVPLAQVKALAPKGLILSGGPCSVYDADAPAADAGVLALDVPVLGICYGLQFMVHHLGGKVESAAQREYGHAEVSVVRETPLFQGLPGTMDVWMSHGDHAAQLPEGFELTAQTSNAVAGIANEAKTDVGGAVSSGGRAYETGNGAAEELRAGHLRVQAGLDAGALYPSPQMERVKAQVGEGHAICGLSGGVDSSVAAVLVAQGDRRPADVHLRQQRRAAQG